MKADLCDPSFYSIVENNAMQNYFRYVENYSQYDDSLNLRVSLDQNGNLV